MSKAWSEKHNVTKPQSFKDKEETFAVRNAMGTGPYTVKQRDPDVRTVLAKNPTYWGAKDSSPTIPTSWSTRRSRNRRPAWRR